MQLWGILGEDTKDREDREKYNFCLKGRLYKNFVFGGVLGVL